MQGDVFLTREGHEKLQREYEELKGKRRQELSRAIETARELGDLKENAEYHAAKEAQSYNEKRIRELEDIISRARMIDNENIQADKALLGARLIVRNLDDEENEEFLLVSEAESDYTLNKISVTSPLGQAFIGHREGEEVEVKAPAGIMKYRIEKISRG